jgi:hypothetical protein
LQPLLQSHHICTHVQLLWLRMLLPKLLLLLSELLVVLQTRTCLPSIHLQPPRCHAWTIHLKLIVRPSRSAYSCRISQDIEASEPRLYMQNNANYTTIYMIVI